MRVLITGGAGFIGYHLASSHATRGDAVILLDNLFKTEGVADLDFQELLAHPSVRFLQHDLTRPLPESSVVPDALDVVYHLAAINGTQLFYEKPYHVARTNLLLTLQLLEWLEQHRIGRLIYSSTSEVYAGAEAHQLLPIPTDERVPVVFPQPTDRRFSYGTSKFMGEFLCASFAQRPDIQMPWTIIRYHNIYGPRMGHRHVIPEFIARAQRKEDPFEILGGHETRAFCYIDDAIEATFRVATTPACHGEIVHIGNATEEIRIAELATRVMRLMGHQADLRERGSRSGSVSRRCPDTAKLERLTGFTPAVALRAGLSRTIDWYLMASQRNAVPAS